MNVGTNDPGAAPADLKQPTWYGRSFAKFTGIDKNLADFPATSRPGPAGARERLLGLSWAVLACALVTLVALALRSVLAPANLVLLYLMAVVLVAVRFGHRPGLLASILAVLSFDFFLVPPYLSLAVADPQYLLTFAIMLTVALIISHLAAHLRRQGFIAHLGERRASALFDLSRELSAALTDAQIHEIGIRHVEAMFPSKVVLLFADRQGKLASPAVQSAQPVLPAGVALEKAQQLYDQHAAAAPLSAPTTTAGMLYFPLRAPMRIRGMLVVAAQVPQQAAAAEQVRLLQTCAAQIALAVERVHYVEVAQESMLAIATERLRNSLLSAISHDIRTPLTAIVGLSSTLANGRTLSDATRQELAQAIEEDAIRMNSLVTNLLDMARLHAGGVKLNRQWQMLEEVVGSALAILSRALIDHRIEVALPSSLPLLDFDAVLLERVLCNLLDNAAKHAPPGSVVKISAEAAGDDVRVSVEDSGAGIRRGIERTIFDKFTRGEPESALAGVGLGLAICRSIIEAHGGSIWAENRMEGGARFVFTLPRGSPPADAIPETSDFSRADPAA